MADGRGTAQRGTDRRSTASANRAVPDAGTPPGRPAGAAPSASGGAPDVGGLPSTSLLVFQVQKEQSAEAQNICPEPAAENPFRKTKLVTSLAEMVGVVKETADQARVVKFAILAHGDMGGQFSVGKDVVNPGTIASVKGTLEELDRYLAPGADVFLFGCTAATGKDGSILLKELSKLLPGRRIIGFDFVNILNPQNPRKGPGKAGFCSDPDVWVTSAKDAGEWNNSFRSMGKTMIKNQATDEAPQAKIAKDGKIVKFPVDEDPKRHDAELKDRIRVWKGR